MLKNSKIVGFAATAMPDKSKHFYREILGLTLVEETPFALVFESNGIAVRIQITDNVFSPPYTTLGWAVDDILEIVQKLTKAAVVFEKYEGLEQDEFGIWHTPDGTKIAWFKDPDGNVLSLSQYA